jgi:hypothetical protein
LRRAARDASPDWVKIVEGVCSGEEQSQQIAPIIVRTIDKEFLPLLLRLGGKEGDEEK